MVQFTDDICLPNNWIGNISSVEVVCMSNDPSTVDCTGFAGALFSSCFSSPLPILSPGMYNTEQLKSLSVSDNDVEGIRVNNGFSVELFEHDNFAGTSQTFYGPTVICLSSNLKNKVSSMKVTCLSEPDFSNCGFDGVAGAIFQKSSSDVNSHIGVSVGLGDYDMDRLIAIGAGNDNTKQIKVNNGYAITLFEHDNFEGEYTVYLGDESDLSTTITETLYPVWDILGLFPYTNTISMENMTSSMKVRCIESLQNTQNFVIDSEVTLTAEKAGERAKLDVTYDLGKEAIYQTIEKYDGRTGEFEFLSAHAVDTNHGSYTYFDMNTLPGDNIYRVKVYYADETEEETPYEVVHFDTSLPFNIFPNPSTGIVNINLEKYLGKDVEIMIYNLQGTEVARNSFESLSEQIVSFDLSNIITGTYFVRVIPDGKRARTQQVIIINEE